MALKFKYESPKLASLTDERYTYAGCRTGDTFYLTCRDGIHAVGCNEGGAVESINDCSAGIGFGDYDCSDGGEFF